MVNIRELLSNFDSQEIVVLFCAYYLVAYFAYVILTKGYEFVFKQFKNEINEFTQRPDYSLFDYDSILDQIGKAVPPATLGSINLGLYKFLKDIDQQAFYSPEDFFLYSALSFFVTSTLIAMTTHNDSDEHRSKQGYYIQIAFVMGVAFELLGLVFLMTILFSASM